MTPTASNQPILDPTFALPFPKAVLPVLRNPQLRKNVAHAIDVIQTKRGKLVAEKTAWQELRTSADAIRTHVLETQLAEPFAYSQAWYDRRGAMLVEIEAEAVA